MGKLEDIVIYTNDRYYSAFPSVVCMDNGELIVAFRRAPDVRAYQGEGCSHCHPNSYCVLVRSADHGRTWTREPELIFAHPEGGSQDPCMTAMADGSLVVSSYAWMLLTQEANEKAGGDKQRPNMFGWAFCFLGGYFVNSTDRGRTWQGPFKPGLVINNEEAFPGTEIPIFNRGCFIQGSDGPLYWAAAVDIEQRILDCMVSEDRGQTWTKRGRIAQDDKVGFNETSMVETAGGDLLAFARTFDLDGHGVMVRSTDRGRTWQPWQDMGFYGLPFHALRLADDRILLTYGYRREPYGIRARLFDPEATSFESEEIILRDDGGSRDLGYTWSCLTADGRILTVYYFNQADGIRHIAGTFVELD